MGSVYNRGSKAVPKWWIGYKDETGKWCYRASGQPTKAEAAGVLAQIEARIARGELAIPERPTGPPAPKLTLGELCEKFLEEYSRPRITDLKRYRSEHRTMLRAIRDVLDEGRPAEALTKDQVEELRDALAKGYASNSVRHHLRALAKVYAWAVEKKLVPANPCRGVERPAVVTNIEFLGAQERSEPAQLLAHARRAAPSAVFYMIAFCLFTGVRKGEAFGLRWSDVALDLGKIWVRRSYRKPWPKSKKARDLDIHPQLAPLLKEWKDRCPAHKEQLVFPVEVRDREERRARLQEQARGTGDLARAARKRLARIDDTPVKVRMGRADDVLGLDKLIDDAKCSKMKKPWHSLRHTFASHYIMNGGSIVALQQMLGHSTIEMTMVYAHLAPSYRREEIQRIVYPEAPADAGVIDLQERRAAAALAQPPADRL